MSLPAANWHERVVGRSLRVAQQRSIDRGAALIRAAALLLERSNGDGFTVQQVADEAGQSLRTLYQHFASKDDLLLAVFEEAMRAYAQLIRHAIGGLETPLDRLTGALVAVARLPERSSPGVKRSLTRLRLQLAEVEAQAIGRSQAPVVAVVDELLDDAVRAGDLDPAHRQGATYLVLTLLVAAITSATLGNDSGTEPPGVAALVAFALRGLGADADPKRIRRVEARLRFPRGDLRLTNQEAS